MTDYRRVCKEKLGQKAGPRIVELIKKDLAELLGKPVITIDEDVSELGCRLIELSKRRNDIIKDLTQRKVFADLFDAFEDCNGSAKTPETAKITIQNMQKAFREDKIAVDEGDFQIFLGLLEICTERFQVISRLADLRSKKYADSSEKTMPIEEKTSEETKNSDLEENQEPE
jgi:hypothetical protein